jgi:hypothetical protein
MAIVVGSNTALSTAANTKTADLVSGRHQYVGKGKIQLIAKCSAVGMNVTLNVGGIALVDDNVIPFTGTAGSISVKDNVLVEQNVGGGRVEMYLRNSTGGAITTDYVIYFTPM